MLIRTKRTIDSYDWDFFQNFQRGRATLGDFPGVFMWFDFNRAHTMFQDTGATVPAAVGQPVKLVRDPRYSHGFPYQLSQGTTANAPTLVNVDTGLTGIQFDSTDRLYENVVAQPELAFLQNRSSCSIISCLVLPAAAAAKRHYFISRNATGSTRASGILTGTNIFQHQSRRLDADGAQLFGSTATYTTGDRVVRVDDYDYTLSSPTKNVWTYVNGTKVIEGAAAWGAASATSNTPSVEIVLGGTMGGDAFDGGIIIAQAFITPKLSARNRAMLEYLLKKECLIL